MSDILQLTSMSSIILAGIGGLSPDATIIKEEKMTLMEMAYIKNQKGVGDILGPFFDQEGRILDLPHHKQLVGTPLSTLKEMKNVVGVAGGPQKVDAIFGALKGGYIQTLITDEETALSLMEKEVSMRNGYDFST